MDKIKNVFVTGGSSGIGKSIVKRFAQEPDYRVYFTYNSNVLSAKEITEKFPNTFAYKCDITDSTSVKEVVNHLNDKKLAIDILVNNAGIVKDSSFIKMQQCDWDQVIQTNLLSIYLITHSFILDMISKHWGRIINLSSISGQKGSFGQTNYCASKAGVIGFTKSLALETAKKGITVNAIAPGMIDTDMIKTIPNQYLDKILNEIPMNRFGRTEEVADLVFFLSSDNAAYITGQVISINGGMYL